MVPLRGRVFDAGSEVARQVPTGHDPDWLTFTPDSKSVYVAYAGSDYVSVVDVAARKETQRIPVGQVPKRNITAVLQ